MPVLFIRDRNGGLLWEVWPGRAEIPPGAITEGATYILELHDCENASDADLLIDDIQLEALRSRQPCKAIWKWPVGFHAGIVEVVLRLPRGGAQRFSITTDPDLRKLTRNDFDSMVREVLEDTFALFSLGSFRRGIASRPRNRPPPLARLEFLRSRIDEILEAVTAIGRSPRNFLTADTKTVPARCAARASGLEILKSFRSGAILSEQVQPSRLPVSLRGKLPARITVRDRRSSVDIAEHRQIKACLQLWADWMANIADVLAARREFDDVDARTTAMNWASRARRIAKQLSAETSSGFLSDVGHTVPTLRMSALFRSDPRYHRFYRLWQDINLGLAAVFGDFLNMPLARTYELYELWCYLRLLRAAVEEYRVHDVEIGTLFQRDPAGAVTITTGTVSIEVGAGRALAFKRQYREYWIDPYREGSFSRTMIPDIVVADAPAESGNRQLIVLDAKYRIGESLNDALKSIHMYRDALVQEDGGGQVSGIVKGAYLLTPHIPTLGSRFEETPLPARLFHPLYRDKFHFGIVTLRPGMDTSEVRACLRSIMSDFANHT